MHMYIHTAQVTVLAKLRSKHHLEQSVNVLPTFNIQGKEVFILAHILVPVL